MSPSRSAYSHSKLSSYENCPRMYEFRYVKKTPVEREGIEAFVGKRVHEILERLYHHVERHGRPPSLKQVLDRFERDWVYRWHDQVEIIRRENDVDHYRYSGGRCLENYYRTHYPFDEGTTVGIESPIHARLDESGSYTVRGIADRISRRQPGCYEVHDYKTGGWLPPQKRLDEDRQLALYQLGIEQTLPDVESVELVWHYLKFNKTLRSERSREQLDELRSSTIELIDQIEAKTKFPPTPSALCRWCDFRDLCPDAKLEAPEPRPSGRPQQPAAWQGLDDAGPAQPGPLPPDPPPDALPAVPAASPTPVPAAASERPGETSFDGPVQLQLI